MYDEAKAVYYSDIKEKKITGHSAAKKVGQKTGCKLPSDYLSRKEKQQMNSEVITMNPNAPMSWDDFKAMPHDLQQAYVDHVQKNYGATKTDLSLMFGLYHNSFHAYAKEHNIISINQHGTKKTKEQKELWQKFLDGKFDSPEVSVVEEESKQEEVIEQVEDPKEENEHVWRPVTYKHFKLWNTDKQQKYIVNAGAAGYSLDDIARQFGIKRQVLNYYLSMIGLADLLEAEKESKAVEGDVETVPVLEEPKKDWEPETIYDPTKVDFKSIRADENLPEEITKPMIAMAYRYDHPDNHSETVEKPAEKKLAPGSMSINFDHVTSWEALFETLKGIPIDHSVGIRVELWKESE